MGESEGDVSSDTDGVAIGSADSVTLRLLVPESDKDADGVEGID